MTFHDFSQFFVHCGCEAYPYLPYLSEDLEVRCTLVLVKFFGVWTYVGQH
jgi:hypothetical protein